MFTDTQRREIFHFCFLDRLLRQSDSDLYVLKGGVNLRFFFNSPRYSEDMDLDATGGSIDTAVAYCTAVVAPSEMVSAVFHDNAARFVGLNT
ncbi:MAG: nucleotidyl transferase AbiEii/AbiGii toxin family protein [Pseudohongiellaceae bacterium]